MLALVTIMLNGCCETVIDKEEYTNEVPYEEQEAYTEELTYQLVDNKTRSGMSGLNYVVRGIVSVKNTDIETGEFTVEQTFTTLTDAPVTLKTTKRITAGETLTFEEVYDLDYNEDVTHEVKVIPNSITKFRTVTKYRTEKGIKETPRKEGFLCWE